MSKIKLRFLIFLFVVFTIPLFAQNSTNSPYTRYGYGQLSDQAFAGQRGMGGLGIGLRHPKLINPLNPASFSSVDSMTFMLDLGVSAQLGWYTDPLYNATTRKVNGNIDYVAMQFPLYKTLGMGIGFEPVSSVGYTYGEPGNVAGSTTLFTGSGGSNKIYGVLSYEFKRRFSLGVNFAYLFGDIHHDSQVTFTESGSFIRTKTDTLRLSGLTFDIGFQYLHPISKDQWFVLGGVYTPKISITGRSMMADLVTQGSITTVNAWEVKGDYGFDMPESYSVGMTYNKRSKLTLGADFLYQKWADAEFYSKTDTLTNRTKINIGGEFIPDVRSNNYLNRVRYRAGGYYSNSYILVGGKGYNEYGASLGLGLPIVGDRSFLNFSFEYSFLKPKISTLIDEQHFKFTVSYTFNELWFHKRKVQ